MKYVFIGGMSISRAILHVLCSAGHKPELAIGYPTSHSHRSNYAMLEPLASEYGFSLLETNHVDTPENIKRIQAIQPDWIFVFGWSYLVGDEILATPRCGTLGLHMSPLPRGRGRAPVAWTLIKGLDQGCVSLFWLRPDADSGPIVEQRFFPVTIFDDAASLVERTTNISCQILRDVLPLLLTNRLPCIEQDETKATHWPKRTPEDGKIDWCWKSKDIYNFIRGITKPFPGAFTFLAGKKIMVWKAGFLNVTHQHKPGEIIGAYIFHAPHQAGIAVAVSDGIILMHEIETETSLLKGQSLVDFAAIHQGRRFES